MTKPTALAKRDPDPGRQVPIPQRQAWPVLPATVVPTQPGPRSVRLHPKPVAKGNGYCCGVCGAPGSIGQRCGYCREVVR